MVKANTVTALYSLAVNSVTCNSDDVEHIPSVTNARSKLFTIVFIINQAKIFTVYFQITVSNKNKAINTGTYTACEQAVTVGLPQLANSTISCGYSILICLFHL